MSDNAAPQSAFRLRLGVLLLFLWWISFWLAIPLISWLFNIQSSQAKHTLTIAVLAVQTILGIIGIFVAGREVAGLMRHTSRKKLPGIVWQTLVHGSYQTPS